MKISKDQLRQVIKEAIAAALDEQAVAPPLGPDFDPAGRPVTILKGPSEEETTVPTADFPKAGRSSPTFRDEIVDGPAGLPYGEDDWGTNRGSISWNKPMDPYRRAGRRAGAYEGEARADTPMATLVDAGHMGSPSLYDISQTQTPEYLEWEAGKRTEDETLQEEEQLAEFTIVPKPPQEIDYSKPPGQRKKKEEKPIPLPKPKPIPEPKPEPWEQPDPGQKKEKPIDVYPDPGEKTKPKKKREPWEQPDPLDEGTLKRWKKLIK